MNLGLLEMVLTMRLLLLLALLEMVTKLRLGKMQIIVL